MHRAVTAFVVSAVVLAMPVLSAAQQRRQDQPRQEQPRSHGEEPPAERTEDRRGRSADELARAAAGVRQAWLAHDVAKIVANSPQLVIELPGADPSAALGARQAAALLATFLAAAREVELAVRGAREVEPGRGYVEMTRRYRVNGTQDIRAQSLFLGYRRGRQGWVLIELRAIEP